MYLKHFRSRSPSIFSAIGASAPFSDKSKGSTHAQNNPFFQIGQVQKNDIVLRKQINNQKRKWRKRHKIFIVWANIVCGAAANFYM